MIIIFVRKTSYYKSTNQDVQTGAGYRDIRCYDNNVDYFCCAIYRVILRNANRLTFFLCELCEDFESFVFKKTVFLNTKDTKFLHKEYNLSACCND